MNNIEQFLPEIPDNYIHLFLVVAFSLVIGLSQRKLQLKNEKNEAFFGSDRTFTLIGVLSYILYMVDPHSKVFWGVGGCGLLVLLSCNYYFKLMHLRRYGLTSIITACITYCIPALVITQPIPFTLLVLVIVLLLTEMKETFISVANRMNSDEFISLAKFLIIAGIVLPLLPNERIFEEINLTPRNIWLATVIISGMSYISYLLQKFVFRDSGLLIAGILGGLYSSTATTVVLSRKGKKADESLQHRYAGAIFLASSMMFVRIIILLLIFNPALFGYIWGYCLLLFLTAFATGLAVYYHKTPKAETMGKLRDSINDNNPLEFKVALIFASLFVLFTVVTYYVITEFGTQGLTALSLVVGVTDITPFIIGLFQGEYIVSASIIAMAVCCATFSNNLMKMGYALFLGPKNNRRIIVSGFSVICITNLLLLLIMGL
ncbi:MAG: DUF4010 domain-containing protein [Bacteroidales bacterium]|nr:DUF4010 domain-containing protein [Bacteroidales bacterium]MCL2133753.1 DUF4010 domain-containing protein [Bacteroidales bacterium]